MATLPNNPLSSDAPDDHLVDLTLSGTHDAFAQLVNRYYNMVYVVAFGYLKEHDSAEDLAQETFLRAYANLATLRDRRTLPAWLNQIARNHALNWLKQGTRRSRVITMLPLDDFKNTADPTSSSARETVAAREQARRLEQAVLDLPEDLRTTVLLHYTAELSKSEVARRLGVHPSSVGRQLDKAIHLLREKLGSSPGSPTISLPRCNDGVSKTLALITAFSSLSAASQAAFIQSVGGNVFMPVPVSPNQLVTASAGIGKITAWVATAVVAAGIGVSALVMSTSASAPPGDSTGASRFMHRFLSIFTPDKSNSPFSDATVSRSGKDNDATATKTNIPAQFVSTAVSPRPAQSGSMSSPLGPDSVLAVSRRRDFGTTCPVVLVSGRVLFENQQPITTVTVELWSSSDGFVDLDKNSARRLDVSHVAADGTYSVAGDDSGNLTVEVKGVSRAIAEIESANLESTVPAIRRVTQDFLIPLPHTVRGRVITDDNSAITSAQISLRSVDEITDGWYYGNQQTTVSETGEFEISGVAAGKATIGASADGYAGVLLDINVPTSAPVTLSLTTGTASITGHIYQYLAGNPIVGAKLSVRPGGKLHTLGLTRSVTASSDSSGSFHLEHLQSGPHVISARTADGHALYYGLTASNPSIAMLRPVLRDGQTTDVELHMYTGLTISGIVIDKETSEPMSGVAVNLCRYAEPVFTATTDAGGRYQFSNINPYYQFQLRVSHPGFILAIDDDYRSDDVPAVTAWPKHGEVNLVRDLPLLPVVNLSGVVQNPEGFPIADAMLEWEDATLQSMKGKARSDLQGRFQLQFTPFQKGNLKATASGYGFTTTRHIEMYKDDISDLDITMEREAILEGRILTVDDTPIAGAKVAAKVTYPHGLSTMTQDASTAESDANGHYRLEGIPGGKGPVKASADGYIPAEIDVDLQPGDHRTLFDIKLKSGLSIEGTLVDEEGDPIHGTLRLEPNQMEIVRDDGKFKFDGLKPGQFEITATAELGTAKVTVNAGDKNVAIRVSDNTVEVHCSVVDALTGQPVEKFKLSPGNWKYDGEGAGGFRFSARKSSSGQIQMPEIYAWADGYPKHYIQPKPINENETLLIKLGTGSVVTGRIISDPSRQPVPEVPVAVLYDKGVYGQMQKDPPITNTITDAQGRFTLANLPAGKVTIKALPNLPLYPASTKAELKSGETIDIGTIAVGEQGTLRGRIIKLPSTPVPDLELRLIGPYGPMGQDSYGENARTLVSRSDSRGEFTINDLAPGRYSIQMPDRPEYGQYVEVESAKTKDVEIQLGSITITGQITRNGQPLSAKVGYRNKQTNQLFGSGSDLKPTYTIKDVIPGDYTVWTQFQIGENSYRSTTQSLSIPDQSEVIQNLEVP